MYETHHQFSVDDFERAGTTAWEGVRNYEARNLMQGMKLGDKVCLALKIRRPSYARFLQVLFYHSNTKAPGLFSFHLDYMSIH